MWFKNTFSNFTRTATVIGEKVGWLAKVVWQNIPILLKGAKTIGSVLTRSGFVPIGPAIEQGSDAIKSIYDGVNRIIDISKLPDNQ